MILLLFQRDARRKRRNVPMNVCVGDLAAQAQDVNALRRKDQPRGLRDAEYELLQFEILRRGKVAGDLLSMLLRSDDHVTEKRRIPAQKSNGRLCFTNGYVSVVGVTPKKLTDEARA